MAAPTVTRPIAPPPETAAPGGLKVEDVARWAKWVVLALLVAGLIALLSVVIVSYSEQRQTDELRQKWDEVHLALKDKTRAPDRIAALEGVIPKIVGSPAHGYALMALGNAYFDQATSVKYAHDERVSALDKATQIYKLVADTEPFRSNMAFEPMAIGSLATAYEQDGKFDEAIDVLKKAVDDAEIVRCHLYKQLEAQLGREYWLRSLKKTENKQDPESDRKEARRHITEALRTSENERGEQAWREESEFIKAITENPGKALPDGRIPAERVKPAEPEKKDEKKPGEEKKDGADAKKPDEKADKNAAATPAPAAAPNAPAAPAGDKTAPKPDEKKADAPKDPKKDSSINLPDNPEDPSLPVSPSGHLTFSQIQKALKEGRPAICNCPRCQMGNMPPAGVRLAD